MKMLLKMLLVAVLPLLLVQCKVIKQGEVGVKRTVGKIKPAALPAGARWFMPGFSVIIPVPLRTVNLEVKLDLPSREGLNVGAEISILYHVEGTMATELIEKIGKDYERIIILPVFRAAAADITAKYMAKDMHTGNRLEIENHIREKMMEQLRERGIVIESVLLKSIKLPPGLYRAIEEKLEAEQQAQRMEFVLQRERQEAQRRLIEAEGIRNANRILQEGLTPDIIKYKTIEAFKDLSQSPNTKVIVTDGKAPLLIGE